MATQSMTTFTSMLKEKWLPGVAAEFNTSTVLLKQLQRENVTPVNGEYYVMPMNTARNEAVGARSETQTLPTASSQGYAQALLYRAHHYGRFKLTGAVIDAGASGGGVVDVLQNEMMGLKRDMKSMINRALFGDGSGLLAVVTTNSSTTLTINTGANQYGLKYCRVGMPVDVVLRTNGATTNGVLGTSITAIDRSAGTITINDAPAGSLAGGTYGVYLAGTYSEGAALTVSPAPGREMYGLLGAIDDANPGQFFTTNVGGSADVGTGTDPNGRYGTINRNTSANEYWKGNNINNGGVLQSLSLDLMQQAIDLCEINGDGDPSLIICGHALWRRYGNLLSPDRRWMGNIKTLDGGFKALEFDGRPVVRDKDCPPNKMFFLDMSSFRLLVERDLSLMDEDGNALVRDANADAYTGTVIYRAQLGCNAPNKNCIIEDLTE